MKDKKGILGLDTAKAFVLAIMALAIIGFVVVFIMGTLGTTNVGRQSTTVGFANETLATMDEKGEDLVGSTYDFSPVCSILIVTNATNGAVVPATNYTQTNCNLACGNCLAYNNSNWNVSYSLTYQDGTAITSVTENSSQGIVDFMSNAGVWFALLAVVIIILIISVVIVAVNRFGGGSGSSSDFR